MTRIEHINTTVPDINAAIEFIQLVAPDFTVRKDDVSDKGYRWVHIGNDDCYLALQAPYPGIDPQSPQLTYHNIGVNHIGLVIDDAAGTESLLLKNGFKPNGSMVTETHRKRIYFYDRSGFEWEMIEYSTRDPKEKYLYE